MLKTRTARSAITAALLAVICPACAERNQSSDFHEVGETGVLGLQLSLPLDYSIDAIDYLITGPSGYTKSGQLPVAGPAVDFTARIDGIPVGKGYTLKLSVVEPSCNGTAMFDVNAGATSQVNIRLGCHLNRDHNNHGIIVEGSLNACPVVEYANAVPLSASEFALTADASDADGVPAPITYRWMVSSGMVLDSAASNTTLVCPGQAGAVSVKVEVSDSECKDVLALAPITCPAAGSGGSMTPDAGAPAQCAPTQEFSGLLQDDKGQRVDTVLTARVKVVAARDCSMEACPAGSTRTQTRYELEAQPVDGSAGPPAGTRWTLSVQLSALPPNLLVLGQDYDLHVNAAYDESPFSGRALSQTVMLSEQQAPVLMLADLVASSVKPAALDAFDLHFERDRVACAVVGAPFILRQYGLRITSPTASLVIHPGETAPLGQLSLTLVRYTTASFDPFSDEPDRLQFGLFRERR